MRLTLHGYWRSTAAYRVRIALNLKGLGYDHAPVDLRAGSHNAPAFLDVNRQGLVPVLEADGQALTQSLPIIEWLEERFPEPALLPSAPFDRARVRAVAAIIASDIHPLNNLRVLTKLRASLAASDAAVDDWIADWITRGFEAVEPVLGDEGWCFGPDPGLADCCLIPQVYSAKRFGVPLTSFPKIVAIASRAVAHPAFAQAEPERQADAPNPDRTAG